MLRKNIYIKKHNNNEKLYQTIMKQNKYRFQILFSLFIMQILQSILFKKIRI